MENNFNLWPVLSETEIWFTGEITRLGRWLKKKTRDFKDSLIRYQTLAKHANIGTNQVLEHFFDFSRLQEISDVSTGHGYKIFIPFPFLTFLSHSQWPNPSLSDLNPIFPGQKQANPSSHFTTSGLTCSENSRKVHGKLLPFNFI